MLLAVSRMWLLLLRGALGNGSSLALLGLLMLDVFRRRRWCANDCVGAFDVPPVRGATCPDTSAAAAMGSRRARRRRRREHAMVRRRCRDTRASSSAKVPMMVVVVVVVLMVMMAVLRR